MEIADDDIDIEKRVKDLLERGLERYGEGDLEGALAHWKHAQILDPENEKAIQYASYVEDNHDLAEAGSANRSKHTAELDYPFGIEELGLARLRNDELDADYESLVVEREKKKLEAKSAPPPKATTTTELDDGWDVDEEWVAELVVQSDAAFASPTEIADAEEAKPAEEAKQEPAAKEKLDLESASELEAEAAPKLKLKHKGKSTLSIPKISASLAKASLSAPDPVVDEDEDEEDEDEEDDEAYAELEIGVASELSDLDLDSAGTDSESNTSSSDADEAEVDFAALNDAAKSDHDDFESKAASSDADLDLSASDVDPSHDSSDLDLPDMPLELGLTGSGETSSSADLVGGAAAVSFEKGGADIEIGGAGADKAALGSSSFDANETGDVAIPDDASDDDVLARIQSEAPSGDENERTTFIVSKLLERALRLHESGEHATASASAARALEQADDCASAQKLIYAQEDFLVSVLMAGLGEASKIPELVVPLSDIPLDQIDNRAAFLLTRVDGSLSLEEILIVCGMPKLEALRHLSRMHSRSYLSVG